MKFIRQLFCSHEYRCTRLIGGDELNSNGLKRSEWTCKKCGKLRQSSCMDRMD